MDFVYLAREAWKVGDFDTARMYYQKAAYGIHGTDKTNQDAFTQEVAQFAGEDPTYRQGIQLIRGYIAEQNKPVLQSDMTAYVKNHFGEQQVEVLRYVLYYAEVRQDIYRRKQGRSYLLALTYEQLANVPIASSAKKTKKLAVKDHDFLKLLEPNKAYERKPSILTGELLQLGVWKLHGTATQFKKTQWDLAIECLFRAKEIDGQNGEWQSIHNYLRLPLFLQQAGFFESSKFEFIQLINQLGEIVEREAKYHNQKALYKKWLNHLYLSLVFDKIRLSFKREKLNEQAEYFENLAKQYQELADEIQKKLDDNKQPLPESKPITNEPRISARLIQDSASLNRSSNPKIPTSPPNSINANKQNEKTGCIGIIVAVVIFIIWMIL
ncbi:hypothetical protein QDY72_09660 [Kingella negevensis]|uniref:hypothetical protein n=1 Tax=Kingella negevensis TaxID=1522312 RepID=UPI00254FA263|nr:hypothetical protein [Kingella negevensis]MDK4685420.1 hypothetical protein [Kingella negevensis]MDK4708516.1 hypothetical protein [Kingella negevensis]MDK4710287.1 hypothetical protein [Kingella negevensis]